MPTKIENIISAIQTQMATSLSDYKIIPNAYDLDAVGFLNLGPQSYSIGVGAGRDTERYIGCHITWERLFFVSMIRQVTTTENNTTERRVIEKDILADHDIIRKAFYNNSTLSGEAIKTTVVSDSGIRFLDGDRLKFLQLDLDVLVEYQENPS